MATRIGDSKSDFIEEKKKKSEPEPLRLGRRESEPHSAEVTYLYTILSQNYPESRTFWDLHHYFTVDGQEVDLQFDISFFRNLKEPCSISSYKASDYENRIPDMVINVLSVGTWRKDFFEIADFCESLAIPIYIVFSPYEVTSKKYAPPFMRVYMLNSFGRYEEKTVQQISAKEEDPSIDSTCIVPLNPYLNLAVGLEMLKEKHKSGSNRYRLIFIDLETNKKLLTREEKIARLLEEEKRRAEEEKRRAEEEKRRAEEEKRRAEEEKRRAENYFELLKKHNLI